MLRGSPTFDPGFLRPGGAASCQQSLERRHPDDVGLGVVGGAGGFVAFGRGAGRRRHGDDGGGGGDVRLLTVQRNRLLEFGVEAGTTGATAERERDFRTFGSEGPNGDTQTGRL